MHTLATIGFLAIGAVAVLVIFLEVRRKRHYIAYLLRNRPEELPTTSRDWWEAYYTGVGIAVLVVAFLVLS